ncbi:MAG TPA: glycosyltransferase [Candidatus Omnitrophota bacterium]|nr:glycosyltransferase [Candidatus Omnitrophota bacterium]
MENVFLSVIIPYHKKCGDIAPALATLAELLATKPFLSEILVISGDSGLLSSFCEKYQPKVRLEVLPLPEGQVRSQSRSYIFGVEKAGGEWALLLDSDMIALSSAVNSTIAEMRKPYDVIRTYRVNFSRRSPIRRAGSWLVNTIFNAGSKVRLKDVGSSFSAYRRKIYNNVSDPRFRKYHDFLPYAVVKLAEKEKIKEIPVEMPQNIPDVSSYRIADLVRLFFKILSLKITS